MQLNQLKRHTTRKTTKRIGRGGKRGTYSGRGIKGQKARAGNSGRPELRDIIKKLPKLRGHGKNRSRTVHDGRVRAQTVNVSVLNATFANGDVITPSVLAHKGLVTKRAGKLPPVKILASGAIEKKLTCKGVIVSGAAQKKIEAAGGTIVA